MDRCTMNNHEWDITPEPYSEYIKNGECVVRTLDNIYLMPIGGTNFSGDNIIIKSRIGYRVGNKDVRGELLPITDVTHVYNITRKGLINSLNSYKDGFQEVIWCNPYYLSRDELLESYKDLVYKNIERERVEKE